jgi:inner membrane protein
MDPPNLPPGRIWTTVEFTDLRFEFPFIPTSGVVHRGTLGGWVYIIDGHEDAGEAMGGREQH